MKSEELYEILGDISEKHIQEAHMTTAKSVKSAKAKKPAWVTWVKRGAIAACLCLVIFGVTMWNSAQIHTVTTAGNTTGTLPGADEIYPTVMVEGRFYEWRRGAAICSELPEGCVYYGELVHIEGETPNDNKEFVSVFSASGQIYTVPQTDNVVYLCLTTDWLENTVVAFDLVDLVDSQEAQVNTSPQTESQ
jgi:hypothetical protein